jgi:hypothetical protein
MDEKELTDKIKEFFKEINMGNHHPRECKKIAQKGKEIVEEYPKTNISQDNEVLILFRKYISINLSRARVNNEVENILLSPEYRSILFHSDSLEDPKVQRGLGKFVNGFSKSDKRLYEIEEKLAKLLDLSFSYEAY